MLQVLFRPLQDPTDRHRAPGPAGKAKQEPLAKARSQLQKAQAKASANALRADRAQLSLQQQKEKTQELKAELSSLKDRFRKFRHRSPGDGLSMEYQQRMASATSKQHKNQILEELCSRYEASNARGSTEELYETDVAQVHEDKKKKRTRELNYIDMCSRRAKLKHCKTLCHSSYTLLMYCVACMYCCMGPSQVEIGSIFRRVLEKVMLLTTLGYAQKKPIQKKCAQLWRTQRR